MVVIKTKSSAGQFHLWTADSEPNSEPVESVVAIGTLVNIVQNPHTKKDAIQRSTEGLSFSGARAGTSWHRNPGDIGSHKPWLRTAG